MRAYQCTYNMVFRTFSCLNDIVIMHRELIELYISRSIVISNDILNYLYDMKQEKFVCRNYGYPHLNVF